MKRLVMSLVCAMAAAACGGGGDPDPAAAECEALVDLICDRAVECDPGGISHGDCVDELEGELPGGCDEADQVGVGYDDCLAELDTVACADVPVTVQTTCAAVILFEQ
jgi:hypothetical protein